MGNSSSRKLLWQKREDAGFCIYCGKLPPKNKYKGCEICLKDKSKATSKFVKNNSNKIEQYRLFIKFEVLKKYGGICACCAEDQLLFLTIDHKNNNGNKDRIKIYGVKNPPTMSWYLKLRREEKRADLQVLCFNCNLGKAVNLG